jgi:hypothetical protein
MFSMGCGIAFWQRFATPNLRAITLPYVVRSSIRLFILPYPACVRSSVGVGLKPQEDS